MATKKVKVEVNTTNIDFSNSVDKIKSTAKTVNTEVVETAQEVLEDIKNNTVKLRTITAEKFNEIVEKATVENGVKFVKETTEKINDYNVETAEEIIEEIVKGSKAWQNFLAKAMKNGIEFYGDQQELVFDTLESLKGQYKNSNFKFKNLFNFSFNNTAEVATSKVATKTKKVTKKVAAKATTAKKTAKKVADKVVKPSTAKTTKKTVAKKATTKKATAKKTTAAKNNLKAIEGIGPKIEGLLNDAGIKTFQDLASAKQTTLKEILAAAGPRYKMHDPTTWTKQASLAAAGKKEALAKLQDELKGGRVK